MTDAPKTELESLQETVGIVTERKKLPTVTVYTDEGEEVVVVIRKCKVRNIEPILNIINVVFREMGITKLGDLPKVNFDDPSTFLQLIANSAEALNTAIAELCSLNLDEVKELNLDDMVRVFVAEVELNKDFFINQVLPEILKSGLFASLARKVQEAATAPTQETQEQPKEE